MGFAQQLCSKMGPIPGASSAGLKLSAHLGGYKRELTLNCHVQLPNMVFTLTCLLSFQPFFAHFCPDIHTSIPLWVFMNFHSLHPLLSLPQPQTQLHLHGAPSSLSFASLPFAWNQGGYLMLLLSTKLRTICRDTVFYSGPFQEVCVGGADRWHRNLTRLFQTDSAERKWAYGRLGCCVLSAVPQIYFTSAGYICYMKTISGYVLKVLFVPMSALLLNPTSFTPNS